MVGVMVAISLRKHLDCHAEIAGRFPHIGACLHQPRRSGMTEDMRGHVITEAGVGDHIGESPVDAFHWLAVPLDGEPLASPFPAP
jgi:hypothetical protein